MFTNKERGISVQPNEDRWHDITILPCERKRWLSEKDRPADTLNRILAMGRRILMRWHRGFEPGEHQIAWLRRCSEVIAAARQFYTILVECSERLLRYFGFEPAFF